MSRKNFHRYTAFNQQDAATDFDNKSNPTDVSHLDNFGIQLFWNAPTLVGEFFVYVSNDEGLRKEDIINWSQLEFGTPIIVDNTNTDIIININQFPYKWLAVGWTNTSGTGNLTVQLTYKMVGG